MSDIAIRAERISKRFRIGARVERYKTFRDTLTGLAKTSALALRRIGSPQKEKPGDVEEFWALKDVSFEIRRGEVVGIIGHNGAGKSTLLKVLSRITEPTEGYADLFGRVGSLLEVGTGFHPELTGRENTYLNGAILGMRRAEIDRKFDEIVAFAGVEKFIDTPIKHYSSGMYLRLAFAVAVHLETEILFVDEVLAVGDAEFQRKCFKKMSEISNLGLTVVFVSHNMAAVRQICTRGVVLEKGRVVLDGEIEQVSDWYESRSRTGAISRSESVETKDFFVESVEIVPADGLAIKSFGDLVISVAFRAKRLIQDPSLVISFLTADHRRLAMLNFKDFRTAPPVGLGQRAVMGFKVRSLPLLPGEYMLEVVLKDRVTNDWNPLPLLYPLEVVETPVYGGRKLVEGYGVIGLHAEAFDLCGERIAVKTEGCES